MAAIADFKPYPGLGFVGWYNQCVGMGETLGWLTYTGVFERYPDLHVIMTEGYAGWLAFAIQFFDHHWNDSRYGAAQQDGPWPAKLEMPPGFYLKRQAHATFMWDPMAIENRHLTGTDCLLWGNDYPHREGSFPYSQEWIDKQFAGVPETTSMPSPAAMPQRCSASRSTERPTMRKTLIAMILAGALVAGCTSGDDTATDDTTAGSGASTESTPMPTGPAPGVTDDAVQIGVIYVDLAAVQEIVQVDYGDYVGSYEALFDDINAEGGINGRTLEPVIVGVDPLTQPMPTRSASS